jgi:5-methylcytosine-specific restriction endonuclease McrA
VGRTAGVQVEKGGRVLALSAAWFSDGARRRKEARDGRRCVECDRSLESRRTPYCSRRCRWKFHGHYFWDSARSFVLLRDRYTCQVCGQRRRARELEVDHILEIALGGAALEYSNLRTVCRPCHREKSRRFASERARGPRAIPAPSLGEPSRTVGEPSPPGSLRGK